MNSTINLFSLISLSNTVHSKPHRLKLSSTKQHHAESTSLSAESSSLTKRKRKPRPSFVEQVQEKWSRKIGSSRESFPWEEEIKRKENDVVGNRESESFGESESVVGLKREVGFVGRGVSAPWSHGNVVERKELGSGGGVLKGVEKWGGDGNGRDGGGIDLEDVGLKGCENWDEGRTGERLDEGNEDGVDGCDENGDVLVSADRGGDGYNSENEKLKGSRKLDKAERVMIGDELGGSDIKSVRLSGSDRDGYGFDSMNVTSGHSGKWKKGERVENLDEKVGVAYSEDEVDDSESDAVPIGRLRDDSIASNGSVKEGCVKRDRLVELPFRISEELSSGIGDGKKSKSNTVLAEKTIPSHELQRLRRVSLRMYERIKVGSTGITQALVNTIHEKWEVDELVKLKFEEPPHSLNMMRTHTILENRTGGVVIWRSGSSIVLYRGLSYKLPCVQAFGEQVHSNTNIKEQATDIIREAKYITGGRKLFRTTEPSGPDSTKYPQNLSRKEVLQLTELDHLLDDLGPRFTDWTGRPPLPVDADLLPSVVRGYKPPIRLLPYRVRPCLSNMQMTKIRQLARTMPPHFALGRNRDLQGLAKAMVKLWNKNTIAKIAIKRGVVNTCNERMAEELKRLTGGTLVSRNKDFIVFYRGNDFLPHDVTEAVKERQTLADLQQDQEDRARHMASSLFESTKARGGSTVAGTLAETRAAKSRWGHQPSSEDIQNLMRDSALTKQASLVRYFETKLALAKGKLMKAEKALAQVQADLEPTDIPTDSETLSDEERFLFRKMGLSMKPYLLLGRRGVYDGTIENMHLHWKHRELVKIIVKGKTFAQVKHIAISLETESGGVLVSLDKTTKGYAIIVYRGKNYEQPVQLKPKNLLSRREALARSIELQRREALNHHLSKLQEKIEQLKSELEEMKSGKIDQEKSYSNLDVSSFSDDDDDMEDEGDEAYLEVYDSSKEDK